MEKKLINKLMKHLPKLALFSIIVGVLAGVLELYIGHRFILDPLLHNDAGFVYESYFAPTYYGFTKSIVIAITFFLVSIFTFNKKINLLLKSVIIGVLGTAFFGLYYYFTFPPVTLYTTAVIGVVHFTFIAGVSYLASKVLKIKWKKV